MTWSDFEPKHSANVVGRQFLTDNNDSISEIVLELARFGATFALVNDDWTGSDYAMIEFRIGGRGEIQKLRHGNWLIIDQGVPKACTQHELGNLYNVRKPS